MQNLAQLRDFFSIIEKIIIDRLTYFVGCRLHITNLPELYFFVLSGNVPLGTICNVVPKQILKSAKLRRNTYVRSSAVHYYTPKICFNYQEWKSANPKSFSGKSCSQSRILSCSFPRHGRPFDLEVGHGISKHFCPTEDVAESPTNCLKQTTA